MKILRDSSDSDSEHIHVSIQQFCKIFNVSIVLPDYVLEKISHAYSKTQKHAYTG